MLEFIGISITITLVVGLVIYYTLLIVEFDTIFKNVESKKEFLIYWLPFGRAIKKLVKTYNNIP